MNAKEFRKLIDEKGKIEACAQIDPACKTEAQADVMIWLYVSKLLSVRAYAVAGLVLWGQYVFDPTPGCVQSVFRAISGHAKVLVKGGGAVGKCLARGTQVMMHDGTTKSVEYITEGEMVMGDDSSPRRVMGTSRGRSRMFKVIPKKGEPWVCNENHILSLKCSESKMNGDRKTVSSHYTKGSVVDIPVKEFMAKSKTFKERYKQFSVGVEFEEKEVEFDPYIYGLWLGDGGVGNPVLHNADKALVDHWCEYFKGLGYYIYIGGENSGLCRSYYARTGGSKHAFRNFVKGSSNHLGKEIRPEYMLNSREVRMQLLAGIIDTDGTSNGEGYSISTKWPGLGRDIQALARSLGFYASFTAREKSIKSIGFSGMYYHVNIGGDCSEIPTKIKSVHKRKSNKDHLCTSIEIEELPEDDYFGFEVDGNHRFLLGDFTVTHNSYSGIAWVLLDWLADPEYTTVKIVSTTGGHAKSNTFSTIADLHGKKSICPLPGVMRAESLSLVEGDKRACISIVRIKAGEDNSGVLQGFHPLPRPVPHPVFGRSSRVRALLDEAEEIPAGVWTGIENMLTSADGPDTVKVMGFFNPKDITSQTAQLCEPVGGWGEFDIETGVRGSNTWISREKWFVVRIDPKNTENVMQRKVIHHGFQTFEGYTNLQRKHGGNSLPYYCADTETEVLSRRGWLSHDKLRMSDFIYTVNPESGLGEWCKVLEIFSKHYDGELTSMEGRGFSALVTDNHRWAVTNKQRIGNHLTIKETGNLALHDLIPLCRPMNNMADRHSEDFARLVGWLVTDGTYRKKGRGKGVCIYQSQSANPEKCDEIRALLNRLGANASEKLNGDIVHFTFNGELSRKARKHAPGKLLTIGFINSLSESAKIALLDTLVKGDGGIQGGDTKYVCTSNEQQAGIYSALMSLMGIANTTHKRWIETGFMLKNGWVSEGCWMFYVNTRKSKYTRPQSLEIKKIDHSGIVWCPRTKNGTFLARRKGGVYFTGNTFGRGAYPPDGAICVIVPQRVMGVMMGEFIFSGKTTNIGAADIAIDGRDEAVMAVGRAGMATGFRKCQMTEEGPIRWETVYFTEERHCLQMDQIFSLPKGSAKIVGDAIRDNAKRLGIDPHWMMIDATGNGSPVLAYLQIPEVWSPEVRGIDFSSSATETKILAEDLKTAEEEYEGIHSEVWFALSRLGEYGYFCISPTVRSENLERELTGRRYIQGEGKKLRVEEKKLYKKRLGRSPDNADTATIFVHCFRTGGDTQSAPSMTGEAPKERERNPFDDDFHAENVKWLNPSI